MSLIPSRNRNCILEQLENRIQFADPSLIDSPLVSNTTVVRGNPIALSAYGAGYPVYSTTRYTLDSNQNGTSDSGDLVVEMKFESINMGTGYYGHASFDTTNLSPGQYILFGRYTVNGSPGGETNPLITILAPVPVDRFEPSDNDLSTAPTLPRSNQKPVRHTFSSSDTIDISLLNISTYTQVSITVANFGDSAPTLMLSGYFDQSYDQYPATSGNGTRTITATLAPGTYVIRVSPGAATTEYTLALTQSRVKIKPSLTLLPTFKTTSSEFQGALELNGTVFPAFGNSAVRFYTDSNGDGKFNPLVDTQVSVTTPAQSTFFHRIPADSLSFLRPNQFNTLFAALVSNGGNIIGHTSALVYYGDKTPVTLTTQTNLSRSAFQGTRIPVTLTFQNQLTSPVTVPITVQFNFSGSYPYSSTSQATFKLKLSPGASQSFRHNLVIPADLPRSSFSISATILATDLMTNDESPTYFDNRFFSPPTVYFEAEYASTNSLSTAPLRLTITNTGTATGTLRDALRFLSSADSTLTDDDLLLFQTTLRLTLKPGQSRTLTFKLPSSALPSTPSYLLTTSPSFVNNENTLATQTPISFA